MNLSARQQLRTTPENQIWYRAIRTQHLPTALQTLHARDIAGRFSAGAAAKNPFRLLYLAENHLVALFEARAILGSPSGYPGVVPVGQQTWTVLNVQVCLNRVADLTDRDEQGKLNTNAQELTGDWRGFDQRQSQGTVAYPVGKAPTQELGEALQSVSWLEGFRTYSAPVSYHKVLVIFPDNLDPASSVRWQDPATGQWHSVL